MYELRVLGTVDLHGPDGRRIGSVLSQPKRLALLTLLALNAPDRVQRDEVMGRLWPEMSESRARNALRQALHYLRRSLGPDVIAGKGAEGIGIVPGRVTCDAAELLRAAAEGRHADVLALHQGELLPAFHLDGTPVEFEHWLEDSRRRIQRAVDEASERVAEAEEAAEKAPKPESPVRAVEAVEPSRPPELAVAAVAPDPAPVPAHGEKRRRWPAAAAVLAVCLVGLWFLLPGSGTGIADAVVGGGDQRDLYLEPVRDLRGPDGATPMAVALTADLAGRLSEARGFRVVLLDTGESPAGDGGVRLRPTLQSDGGAVQLSVLLLDPSSDAVLDRVAVSVDDGPRATADELSGRMAPQIREGVGDVLTLQGLGDRGIEPEALEAVRAAATELDAAKRLNSRGANEAAAAGFAAADSLLRRASEMDPEWVEPTLRRAELSLHSVWLHLIPPNEQRRLAHQEILRGLRLAEAGVGRAPDNARAREVRGVLRYWASQTKPEESEAFQKGSEADLLAAVRRDPGLPQSWNILSVLAENRGDFAVAYQRARRAYVADYSLRVPSDILVRLFTNALEVGDAEGAAEWCAEIHRRQPDYWLGSYCDLKRLAWVGPWSVAESDSLLQEGLRVLPAGNHGGAMRTRLQLLHAVVLARAGDAAGAREILSSVGETEPPSVDLLDLQAWVRTALGETGRAQRLLATAADLNPSVAPRLLRSGRYTELTSYAVVRRDE